MHSKTPIRKYELIHDLFLLIVRRKSIHSFKLIEDDDTQYPIEVPSSQTGTMTESQLSQDGTHVDMDRNEQSIPSRSGEHAISDVSGKEG